MLKNRNILSSTRLSKKNIKTHSEVPSHPKISRMSLQINNIITSLEKNVKELKTYYRDRQSFKAATSSLHKNKSVFRLKKVLHRNSSQSHLTRPHSQNGKHSKQQDLNHSESKDKNYCDIFEVGKCFLKMYGRQTTNIVELYEFYKKNLQKKDKSTRILASMDMSNPHMGLSLQVGKQSMLRNEQQHEPHRESIKLEEKMAEEKIITEKLESNSKYSNLSKLDHTANTNKNSRPSNLANDLMSKGLYNIANVANLMINKKYKLTKEKEESFQRAKAQRQKVSSVKIDLLKQNDQQLSNTVKLKPFPHQQDSFGTDERASPKVQIAENKTLKLNSEERSVNNILDLNASFQPRSKQFGQDCEISNQKIKCFQKQENIADVQEFQVSSIKKIDEEKVKIDQISGLEQSPIIPQKVKTFEKSKYYVQPIPEKKKSEIEDQKSMTLKSNSRIIDIDLLPFDL